jgi:membrane-associated HD superfamily phosphohydrolase
MVIKAHVSEGVKMAQEAGIPDKIIDFIRTHHGTSVIRYFFEKAKDNDSMKEVTAEEKFRYDGPLPSTKETGILLLADGIEAASRAMKNPTYPRLENLVNRMVDARVNEGQLSHCPLTFRDLQLIKESFLTVLMGIYHHRVEYPADPNEKTETPRSEEGNADSNGASDAGASGANSIPKGEAAGSEDGSGSEDRANSEPKAE